MSDLPKVKLPHQPDFGVENLNGEVDLSGPYLVVSATPTQVVVTVTTTIAGHLHRLEEKLTPHDPHPRALANWRAAAEQLGLKP